MEIVFAPELNKISSIIQEKFQETFQLFQERFKIHPAVNMF